MAPGNPVQGPTRPGPLNIGWSAGQAVKRTRGTPSETRTDQYGPIRRSGRARPRGPSIQRLNPTSSARLANTDGSSVANECSAERVGPMTKSCRLGRQDGSARVAHGRTVVGRATAAPAAGGA
ncbi:MAG TPA: hypothetical protein VH247_11925 [Thermoleophilaceae bacterium]|nr:hypothetical protein [Thermoleophilaceae bacterium]